jgi:flagellar export protein FliJ
MVPFSFRPEIVLNLRRREEEAARQALARQRALRDQAHGLVAAAREAVAEAGRRLDSAAAHGSTHGALEWHRSWIARLRLGVHAAMRAATEADQAAGRAAVALNQAMQKRRVLERLRERAWQKYCVVRDRAHIQEMDQLASLRYAAQALDSGGTHDNHAHVRNSQRPAGPRFGGGYRHPGP